MPGGVLCPWCRYYNPADSGRCGRCERWLPPPALAGLVRQAREIDLWATKLLVGLCAVVFALEIASGLGGELPILTGVKFSTLLRFGALLGPTPGGELAWLEPWRLLASCFVHMGLLHLAFNGLALVDLGRIVEREHGGQRLVISFVVTGILGFVVSTLWYQHTGQPYITAGASGAVFGIDGVLLGDLMLRRDPRWKSLLVRTLLYSFVFYFAIGTNQAAHLGGLVVGLALGALFRLESRPWKIAAVTVPLTAVGLLASVASVGLSAASPLWRQMREAEEQREIARDLMEDQMTRAIRGETPRPPGGALDEATDEDDGGGDDGGVTGEEAGDHAGPAGTEPGADPRPDAPGGPAGAAPGDAPTDAGTGGLPGPRS